MPDPNSSTRRAFYCQESLWLSFSTLAMQRGCTVDALINEAMSAYLQANPAAMTPPMQPPAKNPMVAQPMPYQRPGFPQEQPNIPLRAPIPAPQSIPAPSRQAQNYARPVQPIPTSPYQSQVPIQQPIAMSPQNGIAPPPTPVNNYRKPPSIFDDPMKDAQSSGGKAMVLASLSAAPQPQPLMQPQAYPMAQNYGQPPLYIIFANQKYTVDKDKYIIGRSSQLADLVIRDGNISRKHCAVIFKNGAYYIKDLDSTNGIEFQGQRIDTKRIEEGDQFNICEFQFTFTYR